MALTDTLNRPLPRLADLPLPAWLRLVGPLIPALIVFALAIHPGAGITPDSEKYLLAAASLRSSGDFGDSFLLWPPLYPALLSFSSAPLALAAWMGHAGALLTLLGVWALGRRFVAPVPLAVGLLALVCLPTFGWLFAHVWSETVYLPMAVWLAYFWTRWLEGGRGGIAACGLLALALLTRHVGVVLAAAMGLSLLASPLSMRAKAWGVGGIGVACIPYALWIARTYELSGTIAGPRAPLANPSLSHQLDLFGQTWGHWLAPHFRPDGGIVIGLAVVAAVALIGWRGRRSAVLTFAALFVLGHSVLTVYTASRTFLDVDQRTLFPILWPALLLGLWAVQGRGKVAGYALAAYALFWFTAPNAIVNALV